MTNTQLELQSHVKGIANQIHYAKYDFDKHYSDFEEPCAGDYLKDVLDINYIINRDRTYKGARILVAFGGPNIWIDTSKGIVEGFWGTDSAIAYFTDNLGLADYLEQLFNSY